MRRFKRHENEPREVKAEVRRMIAERRRSLAGIEIERVGVTEGQGLRGLAIAVLPDGRRDGGVAL